MSQIKNGDGIDWFDGAVQVKLRLTDDPEILKARKRDRTSWQTKNGKEELALRHNSREYRFAKGVDVIVPAPVAHGLLNSSATIVGDDMVSGEFLPALEIVTHWNLGEREPNRTRQPECPQCGKMCDSMKALAEHLIDEHADEPVEA